MRRGRGRSRVLRGKLSPGPGGLRARGVGVGWGAICRAARAALRFGEVALPGRGRPSRGESAKGVSFHFPRQLRRMRRRAGLGRRRLAPRA